MRPGERHDADDGFRATYAADGERVTKWDSQTGNHVYSFGLHDTDGNTVHTPGLSFRKGNGTERTFHGDWLGSTRYLTGGGGNGAPAAMRFDAYGQRTARAGQDGGYPTEFQYAGAWGYEREPAGDADLGLDYLYQRYYDPAAGRFISRDPIGWEGGLNLYAYVDNGPVAFADDTGESRRRAGPQGSNRYRPIGRSGPRAGSFLLGGAQRAVNILRLMHNLRRPLQHPLSQRRPAGIEARGSGFSYQRDLAIQQDVLRGRPSLYGRCDRKALTTALRDETHYFTEWFSPVIGGRQLHSLEGTRHAWKGLTRPSPLLSREALERYAELARRNISDHNNEHKRNDLIKEVQGTRLRLILREIFLREVEGRW